jgi:hypothetical protein
MKPVPKYTKERYSESIAALYGIFRTLKNAPRMDFESFFNLCAGEFQRSEFTNFDQWAWSKYNVIKQKIANNTLPA